jgi:hypothetical protein
MADHAAEAQRGEGGARFSLTLECDGVKYASNSWGPEAPTPDEVKAWMEAAFAEHLRNCRG